jgi:probable HAF family extracellular repeat protein
MRKQLMILAATAALGGLLALSPTSKAHALGYTFTDINVPGSLPGSTGFFVPGVNNLGQVVGTYYDKVGNADGFLYSGGKYVTVDAPGALDTYVYGINDLGQMVGTAVYSNAEYNFIDTRGKFTVISGAIEPFAINDSDQVFGYLGDVKWGVLNANGAVAPVDLSGAPGSAFPSGFNNLDQFTGTVCDSAGYCQGFIDTKGVFTKFAPPNATYTDGGGINDWGQVAGEYFDGQNNGYGFLDTNGHFTTIQDPNASAAMGGTDPSGVNDLGQIVGWYYDAQGDIHAFLATPNLGLFAFAAAAHLADPVPEPSNWVMTAVGFAGLGWLARLRRRDLRPA